jgi:hypothetical protein
MATYQELLDIQSKLTSQVNNISAALNAKEANLSQRESQIKQGLQPVYGAQDLEKNLARTFGPMAPGNLGDINKVIWPFWFTTDTPTTPIAANETFQTSFSITQEAAFIMMSFTKAVYRADLGNWQYLDPNDPTDVYGKAPGLVFTLRDGSSSRQFFNSIAIPAGAYGNPRFPSKLPRPIMFLPNQVVEVSFFNNDPVASYVPLLTAFGYRMRIEDAQRFLSLVYA